MPDLVEIYQKAEHAVTKVGQEIGMLEQGCLKANDDVENALQEFKHHMDHGTANPESAFNRLTNTVRERINSWSEMQRQKCNLAAGISHKMEEQVSCVARRIDRLDRDIEGLEARIQMEAAQLAASQAAAPRPPAPSPRPPAPAPQQPPAPARRFSRHVAASAGPPLGPPAAAASTASVSATELAVPRAGRVDRAPGTHRGPGRPPKQRGPTQPPRAADADRRPRAPLLSQVLEPPAAADVVPVRPVAAAQPAMPPRPPDVPSHFRPFTFTLPGRPPFVELVDPNEKMYCTCQQPSQGAMIGCDNDDCKGEWFHYACMGVSEPPAEGEEWYCPDCRKSLGLA